MWKRRILWFLVIGIPLILSYMNGIDFVVERSKNPSGLKTLVEYIVNYFTGNTPLYIHVVIFVFFGLLVFPEYTIYKIRDRFKYKLKKQEQLPKKEKDFKIKIHNFDFLGTFAMNDDGKTIHYMTVEITLTFIPKKVAKFEELYLSIDDVRFKQKKIKASTLKLPFTIRKQQIHKACFVFPSFCLSSRREIIKLIAFVDNQEYESERKYVYNAKRLTFDILNS